MTLISAFLMVVIQNFYSQMVRTSLKGDDSLDSFRAAHRLFNSIKKDLESFDKVDTDGAICNVDVMQNSLPATATFSSKLTIAAGRKRIEYSRIGNDEKFSIERTETDLLDNSVKRREFGVAKIRSFEVLTIIKKQKKGNSESSFAQLMSNLVVKSDDQLFPAEEIRLTNTFFPEQLVSSSWNYINPE